MVLSNKKLKQKLRAAKAELITYSGAQNNFTDKKSEKSQDSGSKASDSLRTILNLEAQRSKSSKRERPRRVKQIQKTLSENADIIDNGERSGNVELKLQDGMNSDAVKVEKKKMKKTKRKRDESEASENVVEKKRKGDEIGESENLKKKKKSKKKKRPLQWWLVKKKNKDKNKSEEVDNGAVKDEGVNQNESGLTSKTVSDMIIDTDRKNIEMSYKVYVGGIPYYSTEDDIRSYFEGCGTITCIDCMTFPDTGKFRGIAIITFKTDAAAKRALALDGSDMGGLFLKIQPFSSARDNKLPKFSPSVPEGYNRIYVGNLSWDITEDDLRNILVGCTIKTIRFGEDKETGEFKGYAHVDLADSLSLKASLKLDQTVVRGRPIRVSCAVPVLKKGTIPNLKPMPKDNQVDNGKEVNTASFKTPTQDNQVYSEKVSMVVANQVPSSGEDAVNSKIRRRTCYECGERGHLSSACPKIQAANPAYPDNQVNTATGWEVTAASLKTPPENNLVYKENVSFQVTNSDTTATNAKIRRRTCYECGEKGHLSSACPKIQSADPTIPENQVDSGKEITAASLKTTPEYNQFLGDNISIPAENQATSNGTSAVNSKIRRRTCYECGERGHLSSSCPK